MPSLILKVVAGSLAALLAGVADCTAAGFDADAVRFSQSTAPNATTLRQRRAGSIWSR